MNISKFPNYLFILLLMTLVMPGCGPDDPGIWKNDKIKAGKREDFHQMNESFFKAAKTADVNSAQVLMSAAMLENNSFTNRQVEIIGNHLKTDEYRLFDEYYVIHDLKGPDTIRSGRSGINNYNLYYTSVTQEMYFAFYLPKSGRRQWMISLVYGKFNYGWKLCSIGVDEYKKNGKTAPELYELAQEQYKKGYLADAINTMSLARDCQRPADMWIYPHERDWNIFYGMMVQKANDTYKFPIMIKQLPGQPKIFRISTQTLDEGTYPSIYYLSKIDVKDTTGLKKENEAIKKVIGNLLPGIDKDKKYVFYTAFNQLPGGKKEVPFFDMTDIHPSMP